MIDDDQYTVIVTSVIAGGDQNTNLNVMINTNNISNINFAMN